MSLAPQYLFRIWDILDLSGKRKIIILILGMLLAAVFDALTIASVIPFLKAIIDPEFSKLLILKYFSFFPTLENYKYNILITLIFLFFIFFSSVLRIFILWRSAKISSIIGSYLSTKVFSNVINQYYEDYTNMNSSEFITASTNYVEQTLQILYATFTILSSSIIITGLLSVIIISKPIVAIVLIFLILFTYIAIAKLSKNKLKNYSKVIASESQNQVRTLQKGFGSFKDIKLANSQKFFIKKYNEIDLNLRIKQAEASFISFYPRYVLEAISITGFVIVAFMISNIIDNPIDFFPFLGTLALAAQKLLPLSQNIYNSWAIIKSRDKSLYYLLDLINELSNKKEDFNFLVEKTKELNFKNLVFKDLSFGYKSRSDSSLLLKNINFEINKGEKIAFIGPTGSGKSTLLELVMGLLKPSKGQIFLNKRKLHNAEELNLLYAWRNSVSNVPQDIYISEGSITENIALCDYKEINNQKVYKAAKLAKLDKFIDSLKYKYMTKLGERGIKLSGGQIQRLALARAIYKDSKILILDEATSALDYKTESEIISAIESLPLEYTIIYVAHRIETIKNCDKVFRIKNGSISLVNEIK